MELDLTQFDEDLQELLMECHQNPSNVSLIASACYALNIRSRHNLCRDFARRGLAMEPFHGELYYELIIASSLEDGPILEEILSEQEGILLVRPNDLAAMRNIALLHYFLEEDEEADRQLEGLLEDRDADEIDRQTYEVLTQLKYTMGDYESCIRFADMASAKPGPQARVTRLQGLCYQELDQSERALACFEQALVQEPCFVWACHSLGALHFERDQYREAFRFFGKATYINPSDPGNLFLLAEAFMDREENDLAIAELTKLLMCHPHKRIKAEVHNALGFLYIKLGQFPTARQHLAQAIELEPELAVAYFNMGQLANQEHQYALAERHFRNALAIDPQHLESWLELGFLNLREKKLPAAEHAFLSALDLEPEEAGAFMGLSKLKQAQEDRAAQLSYAQQAAALDPQHSEILNNLGIACECNQKEDEAIEAYEQALESDPLNAAAANNLGFLFEKKMADHPTEPEFREKAIAAWKQRLKVSMALGKSTEGASKHLSQLGLSATDIAAVASQYRELDEAF